MLARRIMQRNARVARILLHDDDVLAAVVVIELFNSGLAALLVLCTAVDVKRIVTKGLGECLHRRRLRTKIDIDELRVFCGKPSVLRQGLVIFFLREVCTFDVKWANIIMLHHGLMEDNHLAPHLHILTCELDSLACLDGFQQVALCTAVELLAQGLIQVAVVLVVAQDFKTFVNRLANALPYEDKATVIVFVYFQLAATNDARLGHIVVELYLHGAVVHLAVWPRELVVTHAIAEVLHHELVTAVALIVASKLALVALVVPKVALAIVHILVVGKRRSRQEDDTRLFLLWHLLPFFEHVRMSLAQLIQLRVIVCLQVPDMLVETV